MAQSPLPGREKDHDDGKCRGSGGAAAVQISVIDTKIMTIGQALEMLCAGCQAVPVPQPITLTNRLPVLRAVGDPATEGTPPLEFYIVEFGPKAIIFVVDQAKAGMDADTLLGTLGPLDGTRPAGENTGRSLYEGISFSLPQSLASWASGQSVAAVAGLAERMHWYNRSASHRSLRTRTFHHQHVQERRYDDLATLVTMQWREALAEPPGLCQHSAG